ncbi:hypothetical protein Bbelb_222040 [Branchiostoma belcheri]|nr:hypothetical protein Bbelb_222040 [Branchiostoma belcheri]
MVIVVSLLKKPTLQQKKHETKQIKAQDMKGLSSGLSLKTPSHSRKITLPARLCALRDSFGSINTHTAGALSITERYCTYGNGERSFIVAVVNDPAQDEARKGVVRGGAAAAGREMRCAREEMSRGLAYTWPGNQTAVSSALSLRRRERFGPPTRPQLPRFGEVLGYLAHNVWASELDTVLGTISDCKGYSVMISQGETEMTNQDSNSRPSGLEPSSRHGTCSLRMSPDVMT